MRWILGFIWSWLWSIDQSGRAFPSREWLLERTLANFDLPDGLPGLSVASPSTTRPNYYYHWIRDGALAIGTLVGQLERHDDQYSDRIRALVESYISSSRQLQIVPTLSGTLGEPKFYIDGAPFNEPWGRPQNDGPALRVMALAKYAQSLSVARNHRLFQQVIRADLDFILSSWQDQCFDVWEEVYGVHFFTVLSQYGAVKAGAALAKQAGLGSYVQAYKATLRKMERYINTKFLAHELIFEHSPIYLAGRCGIDSASVLAVKTLTSLAGWTEPINGPLLVNMTDVRLHNTIEFLNADFQLRYPINYESPGGVGRYPEDAYDGYTVSLGNPWFLTTAAVAETLIANGLIDEAHAHVKFIAAHRGEDSLSEQINRYTGYMQGASSLTWSYTQVLELLETINDLNLDGRHPIQLDEPTYEPSPVWTWARFGIV
ncbi:Glucoamylase GLU1 [Wickerhamiella sorbophila]|uniref:glucan 1,4-alpha-glucosidase n=1 Tax=Wickerhamiella sorbophila TaxID=45607 RepID=A0A2T0FFS4_9ASCO|nr:Glucoamylase GLU1 [Wickerhamiella sorbophila]PRT53817.1 Glucoamylase GLU1 [Wickerhamiella sorbophila]